MSFFIYNSLSQKKEVFTPINPPQVKMYCCGPTVYDLLHIGNFRGAVFFNFFRQWLEYKGYQVSYAYNFTDVDDKILKRAKKENKTMKEIADKYISEFKKDFQLLKLKKHEHNPQATQFIQDMIELIQELLDRKKAYIVDQDVFYSVKSFYDYGKLSKRKADELLSGARVDVNKKKKDPIDFALWKGCTEKDTGWHTPWGYGRPGWHMECTTMIFSILGENIDIHGGGTDLIFPHHENELAQAEGARKGPFVKYWIHNNMFTFGGEKMAKSVGNISTMRSFLEEYNGEIFKYMVLSSHYRSATEVSTSKVLHCIQALYRIYSFLKTADEILKKQKINMPKAPQDIIQAEENIEKHLNDDLNTPSALSILFTLVRDFNDKKQNNKNTFPILEYAFSIKNTVLKYGKIMSLFQEPPTQFLQQIEDIFLKKNKIDKEKVNKLVKLRDQARKNKDFKKADEIRTQLMDISIEVKDSPQGTIWETKKTGFLS